ncbi:MAG: L-fucose:H+ symporter permease [Bacteroidia bacterium]|nr:L-fucose:H+ symporter permease [Bacteroidia bacterium]
MKHEKLTTKENLIPFILITALFFLWGMAHGMLDVLNKHFQDVLQISRSKSGLIQFSVYMAYFTMALPAGIFMGRFGYKKGIVFGLLLFATGAYIIVPASLIQSFWLFLTGLFVLGCGLTTLETAANPYTTKLGPKETAERRINFSQSFNGLAWIIGPIIGGLFILGNDGGETGNKLHSIIMPYAMIGTLVLIIALIYMRTTLPEITEEQQEHYKAAADTSVILLKPLIKHSHFVFAVIAQFCYVAAQTGIFSFFVNYMTDPELQPHFDNKTAALMLGIGGFGLFMIGRVSGSWMMRYVKPSKILAIYSACCCILLPVVSLGLGLISIISLFLLFFLMSIMFPTIFALGIKDLGEKTKKAASYIVMAIVGGAIFPMFMGWIADISSMAVGFFVPIPLFLFILFFALRGHKVVA